MTIKDIARESGYALGTVSRALNGKPDVSQEARQKILAVAKEKDFVVNSNARQLKQNSTTSVAILFKGISNLLFASLAEKMQSLIEEAGYTVLVHYFDEDSDEVAEAERLCREQKPLGLVFLGGNLENFRRGFRKIKLPSVLVTNSAAALGYANLSSVATDDVAGARAAVDFLLDSGHRNIGVIGGNRLVSFTSELRFRGCVEAFERHGLAFDSAGQYEQARYSYESGYIAMKGLLGRMPNMTAVFAMRDVMAVGACRAICDAGLSVPDDISVVGYDGVPLASYYNPVLATVRQDGDKLAARGVEILMDCIRRGAPASHELTGFSLVKGASVKAI